MNHSSLDSFIAILAPDKRNVIVSIVLVQQAYYVDGKYLPIPQFPEIAFDEAKTLIERLVVLCGENCVNVLVQMPNITLVFSAKPL